MTAWAVLPLTGALLVTLAAPAAAATAPAPERTAWFSAASGGGLAAPQPSTAEGDLKVGRAVETTALSTLLFRGEGVRAALDLAVRDGSGAGTPGVVACPTVGLDWEAGGNQPMDAAPEVDCERSIAYAVLSEDGTTLSFGLDSRFQVEPGAWSVALVPAPGGVTAGPPPKAPLPFTLDVAAPEAGAFVLEQEFALPALPTAPSGPVTSGGGTSGDAFLPGGFDLPSTPSDGGAVEMPPLLAGDDAPAVAEPAAPQPAVASQAPANPPVLLARPAGVVEDLGTGRRLLALLVLAGGSAAVGYAAGQQRSAPRLIGGRARVVGAAAAPAEVVPAPDQDRPRGIGRFARTRDTAPRRLR